MASVAPLRVRVYAFQRPGANPLYVGRKLPDKSWQTALRILTDRPVGEVVRDAVAEAFRATGHEVVAGGEDVALGGTVLCAWARSRRPPSLWKAVATVNVTVRAEFPGYPTRRAFERTYETCETTRSLLTLQKKHFEKAFNACLADLGRQLASDPELAAALDADRN
jgi:hypothetical protein